jgi:hypothetical protein
MTASPASFMSHNGFLRPFTLFLLSVAAFMLLQATPGITREAKTSYEVKAKGNASKGDFVRARESAVAQAMRMAVDQYLHEVLGEEEYERHEKSLKNIVHDAGRYVRSYRYITADDNVQAETSEVELEVGLFADALRKRLAVMGILAMQAPAGAKTVVILINEKNLAANNATSFWDTKPLSESILVKTFTSAGIKVIYRDAVRDLINEETILRAAKGDIGAAIEIGQKASADVVLVGNAVSSMLDEGTSTKPVQVGMSLKAISSLKARVVAAKSDFMVVNKPKQSEAEAEALEAVSKKLGDFFLVSIQRFWNPSSLAPSEPAPSPTTPARPLEDL